MTDQITIYGTREHFDKIDKLISTLISTRSSRDTVIPVSEKTMDRINNWLRQYVIDNGFTLHGPNGELKKNKWKTK